MDESKPHPDPKDYHEDEQAARQFEGLVKRAVSISPAEIKKRHDRWEKERKERQSQQKRKKAASVK